MGRDIIAEVWVDWSQKERKSGKNCNNEYNIINPIVDYMANCD